MLSFFGRGSDYPTTSGSTPQLRPHPLPHFQQRPMAPAAHADGPPPVEVTFSGAPTGKIPSLLAQDLISPMGPPAGGPRHPTPPSQRRPLPSPPPSMHKREYPSSHGPG